MPRPSVSVVVPARDAERTIAACLAALARQTLVPADVEVIVVDDGSTDDTAAIAARFAGVRVLRQGRGGADAAPRAGAAAALGEVVAFADPAEPPSETWLATHLRSLAEPRAPRARVGARAVLADPAALAALLVARRIRGRAG